MALSGRWNEPVRTRCQAWRQQQLADGLHTEYCAKPNNHRGNHSAVKVTTTCSAAIPRDLHHEKVEQPC